VESERDVPIVADQIEAPTLARAAGKSTASVTSPPGAPAAKPKLERLAIVESAGTLSDRNDASECRGRTVATPHRQPSGQF